MDQALNMHICRSVCSKNHLYSMYLRVIYHVLMFLPQTLKNMRCLLVTKYFNGGKLINKTNISISCHMNAKQLFYSKVVLFFH